jgi:serine/threonine-protein kinase
LIRELGRGATGVVYRSHDAELEREVAVKLLHPHLAAARQADACARFFAEARVAASLRHPNIVAILDLDERARRIVMELAVGGTLRDVLRDRGPRPVRRSLERHAQILSALAAAHRRGVVHRDLKPGNLMFRRDPDDPGAEVVLGDFGIAHLPGAAPREALAAGTLAYMSPEQRRGADTDTRSDVYAAAVVLFEMLTGRVPWGRASLLAGARRREDFELPSELTSSWPAALASRLQDHLYWIGEPEAHRRLDTPYALDEARELRDLAVAGTQL